MDRRAYLTALGAAAAAVSGCSEGDGTGTANQTKTADGTPTVTEQATPATEQPEPTPSVTDAGLLLDRGAFDGLGDIDSVGQGGLLVVGVEYDLPVDDGSARGLAEAGVRDSDGTELSTDTEDVDAVVTDDSEYHSDRSWFAFDTASWDQGSYTAEVLVNAEGYGTSASTEVPVDIVEPLGPDEVEMYLAEFPDDAVAREEFTWTLGFRNLSDRDSSVVTDTVTFDHAGDEPITISSATRENVPANDETLVESDIRVPYSGAYTYRLPAVGAEVGFTVGYPEE
ncbi:hypothetical protein [Haloarcula onubensis]|uniref:DUF4352 domain-containing protein n=1 Tax=Haloarcula onubensis TaxID=2950539 RepID=A0ABU2FM78_9EURY|nr:hypothetical protein [Halomicroarcula sp. S3CR25-11]MDS0281864.1 hypothetical protein [Halomicroarcula sp. S3CR25-11]